MFGPPSLKKSLMWPLTGKVWRPLLYLIAARSGVVGILGLEAQTKESARRDGAAWLLYGHMFLLCVARPYVSIIRRWAICLCWLAVGVALGHMFLLCGARPYVCIGWLWAWR